MLCAGGDQNQDLGVDTKQLDQIVGQACRVNGGVYRYGAPRAEAVSDNGIEVTALHNHMPTESPRLFFTHLWADDDA